MAYVKMYRMKTRHNILTHPTEWKYNMNIIRMPGFTAEASFSKSDAHYRGDGMLAGLRQGGEVLVQPAARIFCTGGYCCLVGMPWGDICCPTSGKGPCRMV